MAYVIVNSAGKKLSGHYPNAYSGKLAFRQNDWMTFSTLGEAESKLRYIQKHGYGKNLKIRSR